MNYRIFVSTCLVVLLVISPVLAWNDHGHSVIASLAFHRMEPAKRLAVANRIGKHPRFAEDFLEKMPGTVRSADPQVQAEWIFQMAACWPDYARGLPEAEKEKYNHSTWHYINKVEYLQPADEEVMGAIDINQSVVPPAQQVEAMNAVQAIEFARLRVSGQVQVTPEQDAIMLCWLLHLYADLHQPLHSTAMYSQNLFPAGCRGGNRIPTKQGGNLHAFWDNLLGVGLGPIDGGGFLDCQQQAMAMLETKQQMGRWAIEDLSVEAVWTESNLNYRAAGCAAEVKAHLVRLEAARENVVPEYDLPPRYIRFAQQTAKNCAVRAGFRLGEVLNQ